MSRVLTCAEVAGISGDETPLTADDTAAGVRYALKSWRGPALLDDDPHVRGGDWGTGGRLPDGRNVFCIADGWGVWIRITSGEAATAGHVPWRAAKAILAAAHTDDLRALPAHPRTKETRPMTTDNLPTWDEMSDLDKGAALLHAHKRGREGARYAVEHYPAEYFDHPALLALDAKDASAHAVKVTGGYNAACARFGWQEAGRLYDMALDADRAQLHATDGAR